MKFENGSRVVAKLTTIGRKTGLPRAVELAFVYYEGCFYATSSRIEGKHWCQNLIKSPDVEINVMGERSACIGKKVTDEDFRRRILSFRASPPDLERVVFEIRPTS